MMYAKYGGEKGLQNGLCTWLKVCTMFCNDKENTNIETTCV